MNLKLEIEFSKADILKDVDALKKQIDDMRPLPPDVEGRVMQKLRLDWNYNSNAIEGNKLSYGETAAFLSEGITAKGKPLKDHLDIRGHNEAISFLLNIVKESRPISEADIRSLHAMILVEPYEVKAQTATGAPTTKTIRLGEYKTSPNHVKTSTGELHYYATPEETPAKMQDLMNWYLEVSGNASIHPVVAAALFHHKFVAIHPFDDGNGRLSRILMNLILMQKGFPPVVVKMDDRQNYYSLLRRADVGENWAFVEYIAERLRSSLQLFLTAATGGNIDEDSDIDKEIALFKKELDSNVHLKEKRSVDKVNNIIQADVFKLYSAILKKSTQFDAYFFETIQRFRFYYYSNGKLDYDLKRFDENKVEDLIAHMALEKKLYAQVVIELDNKQFKNSENVFDINNYIRIEFHEFEYQFYNSKNEKLLTKFYHEKLSSNEEQGLVKNFIVLFRDSIKSKMEKRKGSES